MKAGTFFATCAVFAAFAISQIPASHAQGVTGDGVSRERTLVIGRISGNPRKHASRLMTLANHLVSRHDAFDDVKIVMIPEPDDMIASAARNEVDIISETVFGALHLERDGGMEPALLEWKGNVRSYHSVVLVRANSPFQKLEDLKGSTITFEDPGSTSGFFLPYVEIMDAGIDLVHVDSAKPVGDELRYRFVGAEINVVGALVRGNADAAAISNVDLDDDEVVTRRFAPHVRVLHETREVPRSLMLYRASLPPADKDRLTELLLGLHETSDGRAILRKYFKVKQFERLTPEDEASLEQLRGVFTAHHAG